MSITYITFDSIKRDKELGLMFGCYCGNNEQMKDAVISLLNVSILGKRITKFDFDNEILYIGFEDICPDSIAKSFLYNKEFVVFHNNREFENIVEIGDDVE